MNGEVNAILFAAERHPDRVPDTVSYVNVYEVARVYGGPEEGGWWYDARALVASVRFRGGEVEAEAWLAKVRGEYAGQGEEPSPRAYAMLGSEPDGTYPEGYIPSGWSDGSTEFDVCIESSPGESETRERPRWE